jgi:hypothetical protein
MRAIVLVTLAVDAATGAVDPIAPFVVSPVREVCWVGIHLG